MVTLYNVTSLDGFIARVNGDEDFIPEELWDYFLNFASQCDVLVLSRRGYESILGYGEDAVARLDALLVPKFVLSGEPEFHPRRGYGVTRSVLEIPKLGTNVLVCSGAAGNDACMQAGIVDRVVTYVLSESIGEGIPQFRNAHVSGVVESTPEQFGMLHTTLLA